MFFFYFDLFFSLLNLSNFWVEIEKDPISGDNETDVKIVLFKTNHMIWRQAKKETIHVTVFSEKNKQILVMFKNRTKINCGTNLL